MICANEKCRKRFPASKPWSKYCKRRCGDAVRARAYQRRLRRRRRVTSRHRGAV